MNILENVLIFFFTKTTLSSIVLLKVKTPPGNLGEPINSKLSRLNSFFSPTFESSQSNAIHLLVVHVVQLNIFSELWLVTHNSRVHLKIQDNNM